MARNVMEINNFTFNPNERPKENYLITQVGERYDDPTLPEELKHYTRVECNKRTTYRYQDALEMDGRLVLN